MKKRFMITAIVSAVLLIGFCISFRIIRENGEKRAYCERASKDYDKIVSLISEECYYDAISKIEGYPSIYHVSNKYFKYLPEKLKGNDDFAGLKKQIADELEQKISELNTIDPMKKPTYPADFERFQQLEEYLDIFIGSYDVLNENGQISHIKLSDLKEKMAECRYQQGLLLYQKGDKGQSIAILREVKESGDLTGEKLTILNIRLDRILANSKATEFKIIGGSNNVKVFKSGKNYSLECLYCGHFAEGVGTIGLREDVGKHYIGDVVEIPSTMVCAGSLAGGCGRISEYTLLVEYE